MKKIITVEDTFLITGRGLVILGRKENDSPEIKAGDLVEILRPDGTIINSQITGIEMIYRKSPSTPEQMKVISFMLKDLSKEDIPKNSIIRLIDK